MNLKALLILSLIVFLVSCTNRGFIRKLDDIKSVGDSSPKVALQSLDSLKQEVKSKSKYAQMKYELLEVRLKDKSYIPATSDITTNTLVEYFKKNGKGTDLQEAFYYSGSAYRDMQDTPRSLWAFLESMNIAEGSEIPDSFLLRNTYSNLHHLYFLVQDYHHALTVALKEYGISKQLHTLKLTTIMHVAENYVRLDSIEQGKKYLSIALRYAQSKDFHYEETASLYSVLYHFSILNDTIDADACYKLLLRKGAVPNGTNHFALGLYQDLKGWAKTAAESFKTALSESDDVYTRYDAAKELHLLYAKTGNSAQSARFATVFINLSDTLDLGLRQEQAATVNNEFNYHRDMVEEQRIMERDKQTQKRLFVVVSCSLAVILGLVIFLLVRRNRNMKRLLLLSEEIEATKKEKENIEANVNKVKGELSEAKHSLITTRQRLQEVYDETHRYKEELSTNERLLEEKIEENKRIVSLINRTKLQEQSSEIIDNIKKAAVGRHVMSELEWKRL